MPAPVSSLSNVTLVFLRGQGGASPKDSFAEFLEFDLGEQPRPGGNDAELALALLGVDSAACCPAGPLRALANEQTDREFHCCADLVTLHPELDNLRMGAPLCDLSADEVEALAALLRPVFARENLSLFIEADGSGVVSSRAPLEFEAAPPSGLCGAALRDALPGGAGAARIRTLQMELQMMLHGHPVNLRREARGLAPANAVWFWGAGRRGEGPVIDLPVLYADDTLLRGLWLQAGQGARIAGLPALPEASAREPAVVSVTRAPELKAYAISEYLRRRRGKPFVLIPEIGALQVSTWGVVARLRRWLSP